MQYKIYDLLNLYLVMSNEVKIKMSEITKKNIIFLNFYYIIIILFLQLFYISVVENNNVSWTFFENLLFINLTNVLNMISCSRGYNIIIV